MPHGAHGSSICPLRFFLLAKAHRDFQPEEPALIAHASGDVLPFSNGV